MANGQGKIVSNSLHLTEDGKYVEKLISVDLQEGPAGIGMPVTKSAAVKMIKDYIELNASNLDQNISISFGRETLLHLLSLSGCEKIAFYFCVNHNKDKSIVAIPINANNESIISTGQFEEESEGQVTTVAEKIVGSEVGGGNTIAEFLEKNSLGVGDVSTTKSNDINLLW